MEALPSSGTTPRSARDDRFYTPRAMANSICSSNDDFFTPRFNVQRTDSGRSFNYPDSKSETGSDYFQTPRSARQLEEAELANSKYNHVRRNSSSKSLNISPRHAAYNHPQPLPRDELPHPHTEKKVPRTVQPAPAAKPLPPQYEYEDDPYYDDTAADEVDELAEEVDVLGVEDPVSANDVEDIFRFARHGRCEEMEKLLDFGIPINIRDNNGSTLLITACQNGNKKVVKSVLRRGGNINGRNYKGNTALHYCYQFGYGETLGEYLISKGADTQIRNMKGNLYMDGL